MLPSIPYRLGCVFCCFWFERVGIPPDDSDPQDISVSCVRASPTLLIVAVCVCVFCLVSVIGLGVHRDTRNS